MRRNSKKLDKLYPMNKIWIDLRSDTFTLPTKEMKEAMFNAELGDDVFGEDPSVNELENYCAQLFGKEAALFCSSGTQTNQIAIKVHTQPGDEVICHELSHIYLYEGGGIAYNSGASVKLLQGNYGRFTAQQAAAAINKDDVHFPSSKLISVENTVNRGGGACWDFSEIQQLKNLCNQSNLMLHLDGARLFNALIANNENPLQYGVAFDTISICLSKGLGAPVGSVLIGNHNQIHKARRIRKVMGGGMRQAGFLAAAGLYALKNNVQRLSIDHERAKQIAEVLANCSFVEEIMPVETNIIIFKLEPTFNAGIFTQKLAEAGIKASAIGNNSIRFVFHLNQSDSDIHKLAEKLADFSLTI
jgi:threonine aldolase